MVETTIHTEVDGETIGWTLSAEVKNFEQEAISPAALKVFKLVGSEGYKIIPIPLRLRETIQNYIMQKVSQWTGKSLSNINLYHEYVSQEEHLKIIEAFRETRFADFGDIAYDWMQEISQHTGLKLHSIIQELGHDHIQIRTVRPGQFDFNPPHKDAYLSFYRDVLNVWIPINYLGAKAIMPVCPGSHLWAEKDITRTAAKAAQIGRFSYRVPAVVAYKKKPLEMIRPNLKEEDCLAFTPYLVHGFGINQTPYTRFALELRLQIIS